MGYDTRFDGEFQLSRVLTLAEARIIEKICDTDTRDLPGERDWQG